MGKVSRFITGRLSTPRMAELREDCAVYSRNPRNREEAHYIGGLLFRHFAELIDLSSKEPLHPDLVRLMLGKPLVEDFPPDLPSAQDSPELLPSNAHRQVAAMKRRLEEVEMDSPDIAQLNDDMLGTYSDMARDLEATRALAKLGMANAIESTLFEVRLLVPEPLLSKR